MDYPKTLTDKDWQKHKGILAKIITALDPWSTKNLMSSPSTATDIQKSILDFAVQLKKVSGSYKAYVK